MSDMLWSDPDEQIKGWSANLRGAGYIFGVDVVDKFCNDNGIELICRSH